MGLICTNNPKFTTQILMGLLYTTIPLGLITSGINDLTDQESDSLNSRKGSWQGYVATKSDSSLIINSIVFNFVLFEAFFILNKNFMACFLIFLMLVLSTLYSVKPFRLKSRPFLDILSSCLGLISVFIFSLAVTVSSGFTLFIPRLIWAILAGCAAIHILTSILDIEVDKKSNDLTTVVFLGKKGSAFLSIIFFILCGFIIGRINIFVISYLALCSLCCLMIVLKPSPKLTSLTLLITIMGFQLLATILFIFDLQFLKSLL